MPVNSPYNQTQYSAGQPVPQPAGNRYIPPTFNYRNNNGSADYSTMNWNNVQGYDLPQQRNNPYTQQYMEGLRGSLSGFGSRYPRQTPTMPQFGGGPSMTYGGFPAQQRGGGGVHEFMANPVGYSSGRSQNWRDPRGEDQYTSYTGDQQFRNQGMRSDGYVSDQSQWFNSDGSRYDPTMMRAAVGITGDDYNPIYDSQGNRINQPGRPQMPNFQGGGQGGMGRWQQMIMDFFSRMNPQQGGGGVIAGGDGQVKPGPNAPTGGTPYDKIGYRG